MVAHSYSYAVASWLAIGQKNKMTKVNKAISNINQIQMHWHDIGAKDLRSMTKISVVRSLWPIFTILKQYTLATGLMVIKSSRHRQTE